MTYRTTNIITHPAFDPRSSATRQSAFFGSSLRASPILSAAELRKIIIQQLG